MRRTILPILALVFAGTRPLAQAIPSLRQGMSYSKARSVVIANGWQAEIKNPMHKEDLQQSLQELAMLKRFELVGTL